MTEVRYFYDGESATSRRAIDYVDDSADCCGMDREEARAILLRAVNTGEDGEVARDMLGDIAPLLEIVVG